MLVIQDRLNLIPIPVLILHMLIHPLFDPNINFSFRNNGCLHVFELPPIHSSILIQKNSIRILMGWIAIMYLYTIAISLWEVKRLLLVKTPECVLTFFNF